MGDENNLEEEWKRIIARQDISKVFNGIEETKNLITDDFPLVKEHYPCAIKINDLGADTMKVALFFEQVFELLTYDFPNEITYKGFQGDLKIAEKVLERSSKEPGIPDQKEILELLERVVQSETLRTKTTKQIEDEIVKINEKVQDDLKQKISVNFYEIGDQIKKKQAQIAEIISKESAVVKPEELTFIKNSIIDLRERLLKIQLVGAVPRTQQGTKLVSPTGLKKYEDVLDSIQDVLRQSQCSYFVCSMMFMSSMFRIERTGLRGIFEDGKRVKHLEEQYEERIKDLDILNDNELNTFKTMIGVKHGGQCFILVSKNAAESFPFIRNKTREDYTYNSKEDFLMSQAQRMIEKCGGPVPDREKFSDIKKRKIDLRCHIIQDIMNLFWLETLARVRLSCQGVNARDENWLLDSIDPMDRPREILDGLKFSTSIYDLFKDITPIKTEFENILGKIDSNWPHEKKAFDDAKNHFYEGALDELRPNNLFVPKSKGAATMKCEIIIWLDILGSENAKIEQVAWSADDVQKNRNTYSKKVELDMKFVDEFLDGIYNELKFLKLHDPQLKNTSVLMTCKNLARKWEKVKNRLTNLCSSALDGDRKKCGQQKKIKDVASPFRSEITTEQASMRSQVKIIQDKLKQIRITSDIIDLHVECSFMFQYEPFMSALQEKDVVLGRSFWDSFWDSFGDFVNSNAIIVGFVAALIVSFIILLTLVLLQ